MCNDVIFLYILFHLLRHWEHPPSLPYKQWNGADAESLCCPSLWGLCTQPSACVSVALILLQALH